MKKRIAMIGDSHSQVLFPMLASSLKESGHEVVYQISKAGWGISSYLTEAQLLSDLVDSDPDVVIVSIGGNNRQLDLQYKQAVKQFYKKLGLFKSIFWIGPFFSTRPDVQKRHDWTNKFYRFNLPKSTRYIDTMSLSKTGHTDGVHFSRSKYKEIADHVMSKITLPLRFPPVLYKHRRPLSLSLILLVAVVVVKGIQNDTIQRN